METEFGDVVGNPLSILSRDAFKIRSAITKDNSIVQDIYPNSSTLEGGCRFCIILQKELPWEVTEGKAFFGCDGPPISLNVVNCYSFEGVLPPRQNPGFVSVKVETSEGRYLGQTLFQYKDQMRELVQKMAHDVNFQARFYQLWSNALYEKSETEEHNKDCNKQRPSTLQNTDYSKGSVTNDSGYLADAESFFSDSSDSSKEDYSKGSVTNDSGYLADAESFFSDSSDSSKEVLPGICASSASVQGGQPLQIPSSNRPPDDVMSGL